MEILFFAEIFVLSILSQGDNIEVTFKRFLSQAKGNRDLGVAEEHKTIEIRINHRVIVWFGIKGNVVKCGRERRKEWCM